MKKLVNVVIGLLIVSLAILSVTNRNIFKSEAEVKTLIEANELLIENKDDKQIDSLSTVFGKAIETSDTQIMSAVELLQPKKEKKEEKKDDKNEEDKEDSTTQDDTKAKIETLKKAIGDKNKTLTELNGTQLKEIADSKNVDLFKYEKEKYKVSPNIWLIIFIIVTAGIIGGWARMNYSILPPLKNSMAELEKKMMAVLAKMKSINTERDDAGQTQLMADTVNNTETELKAITKEMKDILEQVPDPSTRYYTSIVFGVIASSISLLALKFADSQVLKFEATIDYFVLWAWCLLGAVYAKDTLERVYNSRFPKKP